MIDWPEIKGLLALPPRDRPNVITLYADAVAEIVAEVEALKEKNRQLETETLRAADTGILDDNGAPVFWPELVDKLKAENERLKTDLEDARRLAARVLEDKTQAMLEEIIMDAPTLDGYDFTDERAAARAILAYLKGEVS